MEARPRPPDAIIVTEGLTKCYGRTPALSDLDLTVRPGEIFGFLGPNGAGKTTTIRLLLDLIRPTAGWVRVLGGDPRAGGPALRRRIGYLADDTPFTGRQTAQELLTFLGHVRGGVAQAAIRDLADRLALDLSRPMRALSRGNRQKVGLVQAFMHRPDLLILDEPTSGLDPLLQQEFRAMVREVREEGRTVFMSSHVLAEVQAVADRVGIVRDGGLVAVEGVETLRERAVRRVEIRFDGPVAASAFDGVADVRHLEVEWDTLRCVVEGRADALVKAAARFTVVSILSEEPDLEEIFLTYYAGGGGEPAR